MSAKKTYNICTIGGDGIGPEVVNETIRLLKNTPIKFNFQSAEAGYGAYQKYQTPLPEKTIKMCQSSDATLFGAVTSPPNIPNYFSPIVRLRKLLNLYANVRPFSSLPLKNQDGSQSNQTQFSTSSNNNTQYSSSESEGPSDESRSLLPIDLIIVRENTEGLYAGHEKLTDDGAVAERVITKKASERIIRFAFDLAKKQKRKKVTLIHKANVLRITDGLFLQIGTEVAKDYPEIIFEDLLVDSCAMQLIKKPSNFDVLVTTNMFGDILSDEVAALVGGLGVVASANIGDKLGLFEPVHGSAPKYAGQNRANPLACFLAACMMLDFLGENKIADKIRTSILKTVKKGHTTVDLGGTLTMTEFTEKVIKNLQFSSSNVQ